MIRLKIWSFIFKRFFILKGKLQQREFRFHWSRTVWNSAGLNMLKLSIFDWTCSSQWPFRVRKFLFLEYNEIRRLLLCWCRFWAILKITFQFDHQFLRFQTEIYDCKNEPELVRKRFDTIWQIVKTDDPNLDSKFRFQIRLNRSDQLVAI